MNEINRSDYFATAAGNQGTGAAKGAGEKTEAAVGRKEVKGAGTYGDPKLSQKALDYYNSLKGKFGNMNFVLVASDKKQEAEAIKGSFAGGGKLTVLIDTDKIERMAEDESYRNQIEATIRNAASGVSKLAGQLGGNSPVTAYGMTIDDKGNASYFAVVDKSLAAQRERIEKKAGEKREAKRTESSNAARKEAEERLKEKKGTPGAEDPDRVTVTASSIDELLKKLRDYEMGILSDNARTEAEKSVGQSVDYKI